MPAVGGKDWDDWLGLWAKAIVVEEAQLDVRPAPISGVIVELVLRLRNRTGRSASVLVDPNIVSMMRGGSQPIPWVNQTMSMSASGQVTKEEVPFPRAERAIIDPGGVGSSRESVCLCDRVGSESTLLVGSPPVVLDESRGLVFRFILEFTRTAGGEFKLAHHRMLHVGFASLKRLYEHPEDGEFDPVCALRWLGWTRDRQSATFIHDLKASSHPTGALQVALNLAEDQLARELK